MRAVGAVTVGRSDFGIYRPVLDRIVHTPEMRLKVFVGGMHLSPAYGLTVPEVEKSGFEIAARVEMLGRNPTALGVATSVGRGVMKFAKAFHCSPPDILLVLGDRFEMFSAATAATVMNIPLAHIHGGESTEGAVDEAFRHSITKMSHLHFVSHPTYAERVIQMGEEPWRVTVSGAPALDAIRSTRSLSRTALFRALGVPWTRSPLMVTYHPVTLEPGQAERQVGQLIGALNSVPHPIVWTYPNADAEGRQIVRSIERFGVKNPRRVRIIKNLGSRLYYSLMRHSLAMIGNSSSGILEAASFGLPVVNIGRRQWGRLHGRNVVDVGNSSKDVWMGLRRVLGSNFRQSLLGMKNPYGDGHAAERICEVIRRVDLGPKLLRKHFYSKGKVEK